MNSQMPGQSSDSAQAIDKRFDSELEAEVDDFKPLTSEEANAWRKRHPQLTVWRILAGQVLVGALVALAAWWLTGRVQVGWSAGYGALAVIVPAALFARGVSRQRAVGNAGGAMVGFFGWELAKLVLCIAMLAAAPKLVPGLSWLALLISMVIVMKTYWIAFMVRSGVRKTD
jgi:ATP synthase protein I